MNQAFTLTFGDVAENHTGMQKIGHVSASGFNLEDLLYCKKWFEDKNAKVELINLHDHLDEEARVGNEAYVLVVRNAINVLLEEKDSDNLLYKEQEVLEVDKKARMKGVVINKIARYNLCFADDGQEPDYENGKGRIIAFKDVPLLNAVRMKLGDCIGGEKASGLNCEGNYYYDVNKCGIGFHGDSERRKVIGIRLGASIPLHFVWFRAKKEVSKHIIIPELKHGDFYIMSEKAVGFDSYTNKGYVLKHAAGCAKYVGNPN